MEKWNVQFVRRLYFYETTIDNFHSIDLFEFLKEHTEMIESEEFIKWIVEEKLKEDFKKWLDKRGCLDMYIYCLVYNK